MAATQQPSQGFPPGFVDQVAEFLKEQEEEGVERLVCYDRDENVALTIRLPVADPMQAAGDYRKAWQIWRDGGSVIRMRPEPGGGLPQNENRQTLTEIPDFGLDS